MKKPLATYFSGDKQYHADTCQPLMMAAEDNQLTLHAFSRTSYPGEQLPTDFLNELLSIGVWDCRQTQNWGLPKHRNEGIELTYLVKGNVEFGVDSKEYQLKKGDLTLTRPWQPHYVGKPFVGYSKLFWLILDVKVRRPDDKWRWPNWVILSPAQKNELTDKLQHTESHIWQSDIKVNQSILALIKMISKPMNTVCLSELALAINQLLLALLSLLSRKSYPMNKNLSSKMYTVERFLKALPDVCEQNWCLNNMAKECGLKRSQFSEYCYQIKSVSPMDYLKMCRIEHAKHQLGKPELSITDIAFASGFSSSQHFATVFKSVTQQTPRQYRQSLK